MNILKNKTIWFYLQILSAVLVVIAIIDGMITKGLLKNSFPGYIAGIAVVGIALEVVYIFVNLEILPLCVTAAYALVFGLIANLGSYVISDHINGVNFLGGNYSMVIQCLVLTGIALLISVVSLFFNQKKV